MAKKKIKDLHDIVKGLLHQDSRYRDNDSLLVNRIQKQEIEEMGKNISTMNVLDFFKLKAEGRITEDDSITRARRRVNEYYPETRGTSYKRRQQKQLGVIDDVVRGKGTSPDKLQQLRRVQEEANNQNLFKVPSASSFESEGKLEFENNDVFKTAKCPFCQNNFDYRLATCPDC